MEELSDSAENKPVHLVNSYTMPFVRLAQASDIIQNPRLLPVSMPAPSIKNLEEEIRRLQGQTISLNFQPSEAFQADMRRFVESMRQTIEVIAESAVKAFRTLVHVLMGDFDLSVKTQPTHLSKQSRRYLMIKQRERARRLRHGRNRYARTL